MAVVSKHRLWEGFRMRRTPGSLTALAPLGLATLLVGLAGPGTVRLASAQDQTKTDRGTAQSKGADRSPSGGGGYERGGRGYGGSSSGEPDRSKLPDSFKYYGPNGLWYKW